MNMEEENICGFKVTKKRKEIWNAEYDILRIIHNICCENNIKYFLIGGTLLGAVRHDGFIPWDDDIDVGMLREEYEKFLAVCPKYLENTNLFLQTCDTEKLYPNGHIQIRNLDTTCLSVYDYLNLKIGKHLGIFVDIFPYDEVKSERDSVNRKCALAKRIIGIGTSTFNDDNPKKGIKRLIKAMIARTFFKNNQDIEKAIQKVNKLGQKNNGKGLRYVGIPTFSPKNAKATYEKKWLEELTLHKFMDGEFYIPKMYDEILKKNYGDYMALPKERDGSGSLHGTCYFDFENPYTRYKDISREEFNHLFDKMNY